MQSSLSIISKKFWLVDLKFLRDPGKNYLYGKTLSTFNNFCNDFSSVVYCCYLLAVRSTWTRLALKAAIGIKMHPEIGTSVQQLQNFLRNF